MTMVMVVMMTVSVTMAAEQEIDVDFGPRSRRRKQQGDESLASFVTRRLGQECLDKIAEPLVAGIHTSNPDNMSVLATFPRFVQMEQNSGSLILGMLAAVKNRPQATLSGPAPCAFGARSTRASV